MKTKDQRLKDRLEYLHKETEISEFLKSLGWIVTNVQLPPPGKYKVWVKTKGKDCFGRIYNFDGHQWYGELWNWIYEEDVYAWRHPNLNE